MRCTRRVLDAVAGVYIVLMTAIIIAILVLSAVIIALNSCKHGTVFKLDLISTG